METICVHAIIDFPIEENETLHESVQRFRRLIGSLGLKARNIETERTVHKECETEKDTKTLPQEER